MNPDTGTLFLVIGPSGVGKDSLITIAKQKLPNVLFPQRYITRPKDSGGEEHIEISIEEFDHMAANGEFCVWWKAHDLGYGIHRQCLEQVNAGNTMVLNTSRSSIADFEQQFPRTVVIHISAPKDILRQRLLGRGRETAQQVEKRLERAEPEINAEKLVNIENGGSLEAAAQLLIDTITQ